MPDNLYKSMAEHPDIAPVLDHLALVSPVDEFSSALCLVRDCFAQGNTLRNLSRQKLYRMLRARLALMRAYETAVMQAAPGASDFGAALAKLPVQTADELRENYRRQMDELMGRPLNPP